MLPLFFLSPSRNWAFIKDLVNTFYGGDARVRVHFIYVSFRRRSETTCRQKQRVSSGKRAARGLVLRRSSSMAQSPRSRQALQPPKKTHLKKNKKGHTVHTTPCLKRRRPLRDVPEAFVYSQAFVEPLTLVFQICFIVCVCFFAYWVSRDPPPSRPDFHLTPKSGKHS